MLTIFQTKVSQKMSPHMRFADVILNNGLLPDLADKIRKKNYGYTPFLTEAASCPQYVHSAVI